MAISSSPDKRMTLREIYTWISSTFPQTYSMSQADGKGWQNTVRHNLSLNKYFIKAPREHLEIYQSEKSGQPHLSNSARGKGGWWMLDPEISKSLNLDDLKAGMLDAHDLGPRADDDHDSRTPKRGRRGRTSSFATDITSGDEPISPTDPVSNMPSVLQMRGRSPKREYPTVPSVLMPPRTRSAERAVRPPTEGDASSHDGSAQPQHPPFMSTTPANSSSAVQSL
ncbi:hypothetical protein L7F22_066887 [Adiantum nelumboides]|nr:hypothetical protein [Adiantum nelumboides]